MRGVCCDGLESQQLLAPSAMVAMIHLLPATRLQHPAPTHPPCSARASTFTRCACFGGPPGADAQRWCVARRTARQSRSRSRSRWQGRPTRRPRSLRTVGERERRGRAVGRPRHRDRVLLLNGRAVRRATHAPPCTLSICAWRAAICREERGAQGRSRLVGLAHRERPTEAVHWGRKQRLHARVLGMHYMLLTHESDPDGHDLVYVRQCDLRCAHPCTHHLSPLTHCLSTGLLLLRIALLLRPPPALTPRPCTPVKLSGEAHLQLG